MERETAARLHSVAIRLLRTVRAADVETGLSAARLSLLSVLVYGGARTIGALAKLEQVSAPTMTRLVDGLEEDGYVRRRRVAGDGRAVRVEVLAAGRRAVERGRWRRIDLLMEHLEALNEGEWRLLAEAVEVLDARFPRAGGRPASPGR
jgi:DNA-binding MarR family transcriptional regulator